MMAKDTKRVIWITSITEYKTLEKYLEKKAAMGLMLIEIHKSSLVFKKTTPRNLTFNVSLFNSTKVFNAPDHNEEHYYRSLCEDSGWKFCSGNEIFEVFYKEKNKDAIPIYTDSREEYDIIKRIFLKTDFIFMIIMMIVIFNSFNALEFRYDSLFSNIKLFSIVNPFFLLAFGLLLFVPSIIWFIVNKYNVLKENKLVFIPYRGKFIINIIQLCVMVIYIIIAILAFTNGFTSIRGMIFFIPVIGLLIIGIYCGKKVRSENNSKKNILVICAIGLLLIILTNVTMFLVLNNRNYDDDKDIPDNVLVLELSDFSIGEEPQRVYKREKSSFFVPRYLRYNENLVKRSDQNKIKFVNTTYIRSINKKIADFIFDRLIEEEREIQSMKSSKYKKDNQKENEITNIDNKVWGVDRGYYLTSDNTKVIFQKENIVYILDSEIDFSKEDVISICKQKLLNN